MRQRVFKFLNIAVNMKKNLIKVLLISTLVIIFLSDARGEESISDSANEGISLYRQRRYSEASAALEKAVLSTKEPDLYYLLGNTRFMLGQTAKSEEAYREALKLDSGYVPALQNLGRLLYKKKSIRNVLAFSTGYWQKM